MADRDYTISVTHTHRIRFTRGAFDVGNSLLIDLLKTSSRAKVLVFVEENVARAFPQMHQAINCYFSAQSNLELRDVVVAAGAEACKRDEQVLRFAWEKIESEGIDRHSYVFAIGGGAFLDVIGFAAATAHRGIRLVRFPTTTLSQDDSGVGVKNGINLFGKKNWLGSFAVPYAVVNDFEFLHTQPEEVCREGLVEAVKVALVRDQSFFVWLENNARDLAALEREALETAVERSALLHAEHIATGGDPFELGSSRPLDYGHWAAHKLEQLTGFSLSHAQAVSVGIALDSVYSALLGDLSMENARRILSLLATLKLPLYHAELESRDSSGERFVFRGLEEFREHLGGELTIMLLHDLGVGVDVHSMDLAVLDKAIDYLRVYSQNS